MKINNFRQYIMLLKSVTKEDIEATKKDTSKGKKKGLSEYQRGFYNGVILQLDKIYDDCKKYEWKLNPPFPTKTEKQK